MGTALAVAGCGGSDEAPASADATAPTRHFSETGTSTDASVIPADATVPVTAELEQALADLKTAFEQAARVDPALRVQLTQLGSEALQNKAVSMRQLADLRLQAGLVSGLTAIASGSLATLGSAVVARMPEIERAVLKDQTSPTADELKARFDALKNGLEPSVPSNNAPVDETLIPADATVPATPDLQQALGELETQINQAGFSSEKVRLYVLVRFLRAAAAVGDALNMRQLAEFRLGAGAAAGKLALSASPLGTVGSAVLAHLAAVEERAVAGESPDNVADVRARFNALRERLRATA